MTPRDGQTLLQKLLRMTLGVLLSAVFFTITPTVAQAADTVVTDTGITYTVFEGEQTATVTGYDKATGGTDPVIRDTIQVTGLNYPVTSIGDDAFKNAHITSVQIPDTVTSIGDDAFFENNLVTVDLPQNLRHIGEMAFTFNKLTSINLPPHITSIGRGGLHHNKITGSLNIPETLTIIEEDAFSFNRFTEVHIPNTVTRIDTNAFAFNELTSVEIPHGITIINKTVFRKNKLTSIKIPETVNTIRRQAFFDNPLTRIEIPASVQRIGMGAFRNTTSATPADVYFTGVTGPAPEVVFNPDTSAQSYHSSFNHTNTLHYLAERGSDRITPGFTTPQWQGYTTIPTFKVTFNSHGGSAIPADQQTVRVIKNQHAPAPTAQPTRANFLFAGWEDTTNPGVIVDLTTTPIERDVNFRAIWNTERYTVTFDSNGGSTIPNTQRVQTVSRGSFAVAPQPHPTRDGYTFSGWQDSNGIILLDKTPIYSNQVLLAKWDKINVAALANTGPNATSLNLIGLLGAGFIATGLLTLTRSHKIPAHHHPAHTTPPPN